MAKVKVYAIDRNERYEIVGDLLEIITNLRTKKEVIDFIIGLLTPSESLMIARRIQIAKMLVAEDNYEIIRKKLKVSYQTINKVEHWLKNDEQKNKLIVQKIKEIRKAKKYKNYSSGLLGKYPQHRWLKELLG